MKISKSIRDNPEERTVCHHYFRHKDGVVIWIANGFFFFHLETGGSFGIIDWIRTYMAYRWWLNNAPLEVLGK